MTDCRSRWGKEIPFAWVQLPSFQRTGEGWMLVREALLKTLRLPHTGMAITVDIGGSFTHLEGGLQAKGGALQGFVIAGEDQQWRPATARIVDDKVIVSSPEVKQPVAVRYAWEADPVCNLYNGTGLPASPFRTDVWPTPAEPTEKQR